MLLALHASLAWLARAPGILTGADDATYLTLARSLRELGYHDLFRVELPWHAQYPPGYPVLLALWGPLVGERLDGITLLGIAASAAALGLAFLALRRLFSPQVALLCLLPLAVNPYLIATAGEIASEAPYLLFSVLALWALAGREVSPRARFVAGAAALAAALTRSVGATLLVALIAHWLLERRFRAAAGLAAVSTATVGLWLLWTAIAPEQHPGVSYFADAVFRGAAPDRSLAAVLAARLATNLPAYLGAMVPQRLPLPGAPGTLLDNVLAGAVALLSLGFALLLLLRRWRPAALYLLAYAALLALWPYALSRFLVPVLPLLVAAAVLGAGEAAARLRTRWKTPAMLTLALLLTVMGTALTVQMLRETAACARGEPIPTGACLRSDQASFLAAARYAGAHTPADAVFLTAKPPTLYYYSGRRSIGFEDALAGPRHRFLQRLDERGADYILLGSVHSGEPYSLAPRLEENCAWLAVVAVFPPRTYLFRRRDAAGGAEGEAACQAVAEYRRRNLHRDFERDP